MKNSVLYYSVAALLYCPANNEKVAEKVINEAFGKNYSLALCLEDTINDSFVEHAQASLCDSITRIYQARLEKEFYLPKLFIRVRSAAQLLHVYKRLGNAVEVITGFIAPKFSLLNSQEYISALSYLNGKSEKSLYFMPIYESEALINLSTRYEVLYKLKDSLKSIEELILNIRVGGNDLCHIFGFRRTVTESVHQIRPIAQIFSDIITVYGLDYVVSAPVWEYFNGDGWEQGMKRELADDRLCGFNGKTVIHPKQIAVVNEAYAVRRSDYEAAKSVLNWDDKLHTLVSGDYVGERMNEKNTHTNWAEKILLLSEVYGIKD